MLHIFVDADACPVKQEVYRVADRYDLEVTLVANSAMRIPENPRLRLQLVDGSFDAADDWIVDEVGAGDLVVTADIPLAGRCLKCGARVLSPAGKIFRENNIGTTLAVRDLLSELRGAGEMLGGPPPFSRRDRSRFLQKLDELIQEIRREKAAGETEKGLA